MSKIKKETFINEKRPHESGAKHVSGRANYTDDIPESSGTLYGAIGWSKKAHAIIKKLNLEPLSLYRIGNPHSAPSMWWFPDGSFSEAVM